MIAAGFAITRPRKTVPLVTGVVALLPIGGTILSIVWLETTLSEAWPPENDWYFPGAGILLAVLEASFERFAERIAGVVYAQDDICDPALKDLFVEHGVDAGVELLARQPLQLAEEAQVLAGREIGVDGQVLGHVADVTSQLEGRQHPEQAYKVCLGLLNLSKQYPASRLNAACRIANRAGLHRLKQVRAILKSNRDQLPEQLSLAAELPQDHENIRGPHNFH